MVASALPVADAPEVGGSVEPCVEMDVPLPSEDSAPVAQGSVTAADASAPVAQDSVVEEAEECDYSSDASDDLFPSATPVDQVPSDNVFRKRSAPQTSPVSKGAVKKAQHSSPAVSPKSNFLNRGPDVLCEVPQLAACSADHRAILWEIAVDYRKPPDQRKRFCRWTSDPRFIGLKDEDFKTAIKFFNKKFPK